MNKLTIALAALAIPAAAALAADDIVATAKSTGQHDTLAKAIEAAGLADALQGKGPFTVFAPTDAAFGKLPKEKLQDLLKPENKEKLAAILKAHVVAGNIKSSQVKTGEVKTLAGEAIDVEANDGAVSVEGAKVIKADVAASNGTIHVVDSVIMPN